MEYQTPESKPQRNGSFSALRGFVIGSVAGALTTLLLAPRSGRETRTQIKQKSVELRDRAAAKADEVIGRVHATTNRITAEGQQKAQDLKHQGQELLAGQLDRVSEAAQAGKRAIKGS
jgi:gas vesicle protein